jgi:hypothetical protein
MKKIIVLISVMSVGLNLFAGSLKPIAQKISEQQTKLAALAGTELFAISNSSNQKSIQMTAIVSNATVLEFRQGNTQSILSAKPENLNLVIPTKAGVNVELELFRSDFFTPDFTVVTSGSNGQPVPYAGGVHYWGIIKGDNSSLAAISIFNDEVMGLISSPAIGNLVLGKLENDAQGRHILYNDKDLHSTRVPHCDTPEDGLGYGKELDHQGNQTQSVNCIRLYWEVNNDIYTNKGSVSAATNYVTSLFNQSAILYSNDNIPVSLSQVFVWNTASPYTGTTTSALLSQFQSNVNSFNGDLGQLLGYVGNGGIAASISGICNSNTDYRQCYSDINSSFSNVPTYSWSVEVVTHEQGHLMGSRHTHACAWNGNNTAIDNCGPTAGYAYEGSCTGAPTPANGGTIMSYCHLVGAVGINFSNGFGPQPKAAILAKYNAGSCLTACTGSSCNAATGMGTGNIGQTSAVFSWTAAAGAASYNVQYRKTGTTAWTSGSTSTTTFTASGLTAATSYEWQVQTVCSSGSSGFTTSTTFTTAGGTSCGVPAGLASSSVTGSGATCTWGAVAGAVSYTMQWKTTASGTWITVTGITGTLRNLTGLAACTAYQFKVLAVCSSGSGAYSAVAAFTTTGCAASYCASAGTNTTYEYISKVALGSINNTSGSNSGYGNYTSLSTNLAGGSSSTITLTPGFSGTAYREYWKVYVDYNKNGVFTDAGENVATVNSTSAVSASFTVPATALNGATRMRVKMQYNSYAASPCGNYTYGEVEDYTVNITGNAQSPAGDDEAGPGAGVEMTNSVSDMQEFMLYPNPANDVVTVEFEAREAGIVKLGIHNLVGQKIISREQAVREGINQVSINTSALTKGVYLFEMEHGGNVQRQKFLISR